ncbi:MAG: hypothetical protein OEY96_10415, partial [Gammaproteobacteria bacterium]|nr:hypothetical protein [Gammaproteobacteria bacterium]
QSPVSDIPPIKYVHINAGIFHRWAKCIHLDPVKYLKLNIIETAALINNRLKGINNSLYVPL